MAHPVSVTHLLINITVKAKIIFASQDDWIAAPQRRYYSIQPIRELYERAEASS